MASLQFCFFLFSFFPSSFHVTPATDAAFSRAHPTNSFSRENIRPSRLLVFFFKRLYIKIRSIKFERDSGELSFAEKEFRERDAILEQEGRDRCEQEKKKKEKKENSWMKRG